MNAASGTAVPRLQRSVFAAILLVLAGRMVSADNWPRFRGPEGAGHCREAGLPLKWSETENVKWKTPLPGPGMSSPIVWGDRVFLTQAMDRKGRERAVLCFDRADGRLLWQRVTAYDEEEPTYDQEPHYASATPVTDGERVIAFFGSAGMVCYDVEGKELWRRNLGRCEQIWGTASSPILYRDLVIQNFGPGVRTFLIALDKKTGKDVWKVDIPGGSFGDRPPNWNGSWSTPVLARFGGRDELLMQWPGYVKAYDPQTGTELWSCAGLTPLSYTSPLVAPDLVVATAGFGGSCLAVKPGGKGDVTATHRLWHVEKSTQRIGSGVIVGDHVYILNENGVVECMEKMTGRPVWKERASGSAWSSMVHADGRIYFTDQKGETVVLAAKPVFEVLSRNPLNERTQASLAISNGDIFIRTYNHLWCIGTSRK